MMRNIPVQGAGAGVQCREWGMLANEKMSSMGEVSALTRGLFLTGTRHQLLGGLSLWPSSATLQMQAHPSVHPPAGEEFLPAFERGVIPRTAVVIKRQSQQSSPPDMGPLPERP